jgi:glycyl-tRNA synthetase beta chain
VVNAVLNAGGDDVVDAVARAEAVSQVRLSDDFTAIAAAFKRMKNILRQATEAGKWANAKQNVSDAGVIQESAEWVDAQGEPAEKELALQTASTALVAGELRKKKQYAEALIEISKLRPAVDVFFDKVMVMADEEAARKRRLGLLQRLVDEFSTIAVFSEIGN